MYGLTPASLVASGPSTSVDVDTAGFSGTTGAVVTRAADRSPSSSGSFADSLRPRPAISTTVTPSAPRTARTQTRRRWMNSDPASPAMAATAPPSAQPLPGCCEIWKLAHSSVPS